MILHIAAECAVPRRFWISLPNRSVCNFFMLFERLFRRFQNPYDTQTSLPIIEGFAAVLDAIQEISGFELKCFQLLHFRRPHISASITDQKLVNPEFCLYISTFVIDPYFFGRIQIIPYQHLLLTPNERCADL